MELGQGIVISFLNSIPSYAIFAYFGVVGLIFISSCIYLKRSANAKLVNYFKFLWPFIKEQPVGFITITILNVIYRSQTFGSTIILGKIFQRMADFSGDPMQILTYNNGIFLCISLALYVTFICTIGVVSARIQANIMPRLLESIRNYFVSHIIKYSYLYFQQTQKGTLMTQITNIVNCSGSVARSIFNDIIPCHCFAIFSISFFFVTSSYFALILLSWGLLHYAIVFFNIPTFLRRAQNNADLYSDLNANIGDVLDNIFLVKACNSNDFEARYIQEYNSQDILSYIRLKMVNANIMCLADALYYFFFGVVLVSVIIFKWATGAIDLAFAMQVNWVSRSIAVGLYDFTIKIGDILFDIEKCNKALAELHKGSEIKDYSSESIQNRNGAVEFKNVTFLYKKFNFSPQRELLNNFNLKIPHGSKIALVGPSGSGKTTIVHLLMRFFDPISGSILIDNQDIKQVSKESLRRQFSFISQKGYIFNRPVFVNIGYGSPEIRKVLFDKIGQECLFKDLDESIQEQILKASHAAKCHEFIMRSKYGYDSVFGRDISFSGGEQQRINIARAFINSSAKIFILDEATSALDADTEQFISDSIKTITNKTIITIAHRLNTVQDCYIIVMKAGRIVEYGYHDYLMKLDGLYSKLYNKQIGKNNS